MVPARKDPASFSCDRTALLALLASRSEASRAAAFDDGPPEEGRERQQSQRCPREEQRQGEGQSSGARVRRQRWWRLRCFNGAEGEPAERIRGLRVGGSRLRGVRGSQRYSSCPDAAGQGLVFPRAPPCACQGAAGHTISGIFTLRQRSICQDFVKT